MDNIYFLYNNYHYIIAIYSYYKLLSSSYNTYNQGLQLYHWIHPWIFTEIPKENQPITEWININENEDINEDINENETKSLYHTDFYQTNSSNPPHTFHTSDHPYLYDDHLD